MALGLAYRCVLEADSGAEGIVGTNVGWEMGLLIAGMNLCGPATERSRVCLYVGESVVN
jgi:hypothetical protein